ncbi:MAG: hypothetical protein IT473_08630, partial [Lysobacter sp.]|nr:hypothetical protein [Lysobacter sp.]
MRNDPAFSGAGQWLERIETPLSLMSTTLTSPQVAFTYQIKLRAPVVAYTMYSADLGSVGSGGFGCAPAAGDPHPDYAGWCANEAALVAAAQQRWLATELAGCTGASTTLTLDRSANASPFVEQDPNNPQRGIIRSFMGYDTLYRTYQTSAQCAGETSPRTRTWKLRRHVTFLCQTGFKADIASGRADGAYCEPAQSFVAIITGPMQQVCSAQGSPNPCYPATGEKARQEPDFNFASRTFVR